MKIEVTLLQLFFLGLGFAFMLEGMIYFLFPSSIKKMLVHVEEMSPLVLRNFGFLAMITGLFVVYMVLR